MNIVRGNDHLCDILYHAYSWPLYSYVSRTAIFAVMCIVVLLYYVVWLASLPFGILHHSTYGMDL